MPCSDQYLGQTGTTVIRHPSRGRGRPFVPHWLCVTDRLVRLPAGLQTAAGVDPRLATRRCMYRAGNPSRDPGVGLSTAVTERDGAERGVVGRDV